MSLAMSVHASERIEKKSLIQFEKHCIPPLRSPKGENAENVTEVLLDNVQQVCYYNLAGDVSLETSAIIIIVGVSFLCQKKRGLVKKPCGKPHGFFFCRSLGHATHSAITFLPNLTKQIILCNW